MPEGALVVLSAHGVAPRCTRSAPSAASQIVDAVCPLVSKVHAEARRYAARGHKIALVGHAGHVEVEGTMGEAPDSIVLVETPEDVEALELEEGQSLAYLTQTTLSLDDTADVVDALRSACARPRRAALGGHLLRDAEPPGRRQADLRGGDGRPRRRLEDELERKPAGRGRAELRGRRLSDRRRARPRPGWLDGHETVGLTAGASSPEILVERVVARLGELGYDDREDVEIAREDVFFRLPGRAPLVSAE